MRRIGDLLRHILVSALTAALAVGPAAPSFAGPVQKAGGNNRATIDHVDGSKVWTINAPDGSIIHYSSFDIALGEAVNFVQPGASARALNRIFSAAPTKIEGDLTANGHIYIINPAGVVFGSGAHVNAAGLQVVGGHLSDKDFERKIDHFTGLRGKVENDGHINDDGSAARRAVSLVGGQVVNSGEIRVNGGWIVMAAGRDVLIGRDGDNRGFLLRVEGAANAVFNKNARGVENTDTGTLSAGPATAATSGRISLGAGDLYGTAIFSNGAIEARRLALSADNKGDIALGGTVKSDSLDVAFLGNKTGQMHGIPGAAEPTTIRTNTVDMVATGATGDVRVGDGLAFRSLPDGTKGPGTVSVDQQHSLTTSNLAGLELGDHSGIALSLKSAGILTVSDKKLVDGTKLHLVATQGVDLQGKDALTVETLAIESNTTISDGDVVATGKDPDPPDSADPNDPKPAAIDITGNLQFLTPKTKQGDPTPVTVVAAHQGTLRVGSDITTSNGGTLRLEAKNVKLGTVDPTTGAHGGVVDASGSVAPRVEIGFTDPNGAQGTETVELNAINARGVRQNFDDPLVGGGDVVVNATHEVTIHGAVNTSGEQSTSSAANEPGGSVEITAGDKLTVGTITTGGADAPASASDPERGSITLSGKTIVLTGALSATGGTKENADGQRDRSITLRDADTVELDADKVSIAGGDVSVSGKLQEGFKQNPDDPNGPEIQRDVDLSVTSSGVTTLGKGAELHSLAATNRGGDVVFGGDVTAATSVAVAFGTDGAGNWRTSGGDVTVTAHDVSVTASKVNDETATNASAVLAPELKLKLVDVPDDATTTDKNEFEAGRFTLRQDAALDPGSLGALFTPERFVDSLVGKTLDLESHGAVTFDASARTALADTSLTVVGQSFAAPGAVAGDALQLRSFDLTTSDALDVSFDVRATDGIVLQAGASGTGDLTAHSKLWAPSITLIAGDDTGNDGKTAKVVVADGAQFRGDANGTSNAKIVTLQQDADLATLDLPDLSVFGDGTTPLDYRLFSRDGTLTVSDGAAAKIAGTALSLYGQTEIDLGAGLPVLASLAARTPAALDVETNITTQAGGSIELRAGLDGNGDLTIGSRLDADTIDLFAGSGNAASTKAQVVLGDGAHFASGTGKPAHFSLTQDASIGGTGSAIPDASFFGDGSGIAEMELGLHSTGGSVAITDPSQVNGTKLEVFAGHGVTVSGDLDLLSLDATGATFRGNVKTADDLTLHGVTTLGAGDPNAPVTQSLDAGGALLADGAITKSGAGDLSLSAGGALTVADVTTAHRGGALTIHGASSVTTGALDSSGTAVNGKAGGDVTVTSGGAIDVASIDARGAEGIAQTRGGNQPTDGTNGGAVSVTGSKITIGSVDTTGGAGGAPLADSGKSTAGGKGGAITLDSAGGIALESDLRADGGAGASGDPNAPAPVNTWGDVTLRGPVTLLASTESGSVGNEIHGNKVEIDAAVAPGTGESDPNAADTGLRVVADDSLVLGGDLQAGRVDLELHDGDLALGPRQIHADSIRLAASDGASGHTDAVVDLDGLGFAGSDGASPVSAFTLEQDASIAGSAIPDLPGARTKPLALGLVSQDGDVVLAASDLSKVSGTALTLASNGAIQVQGDLSVASLALGTTDGARGSSVGGNTRIDGTLTTGSNDPNRAGELVLTGLGNLDVGGDAHVLGGARFAGAEDQTVSVHGALELEGFDFSKSAGAGKLTVVARNGIALDGATQSLGNDVGQLEIGGKLDGVDVDDPLTKANDGLLLRGFSADGKEQAVIVHGVNAHGNALETAHGNLSVSASAAPTSSTSGPGVGVIQLDGGALANGDAALSGRLALQGGKSLYTFEARRTEADASGELTVGGIASSDGDVLFQARGRDPSLTEPHPAAIHISGDFALEHGLEFDGETDVAGNTAIAATGDVRFDSRIQGAHDLDVTSKGLVELDDDVAMTDGALGLAGDEGVFFASTSDSQAIQAASIALGNGAAPAPKGKASLVREARDPGDVREPNDPRPGRGDLLLAASGGGVSVGAGQALIADGQLDITATKGVTLANTAAKAISIRSGDLTVLGGATVQANSIVTSAAPRATGGGAVFAVPSRNEVSSNVPSDQIIVRSLSPSEAPIEFSFPLEIAQGQLPDVAFPAVTGAALFDYSRQLPQFGPRKPLARPHADPIALESAVQNRPLWAEELLAYLDQRSLQAPDATGRPEDAELLPPVGARPGEALAPTDARVRSAAVENAVALYRELFRPELHRDPDTGVIDQPSRAPEIRAAFQAPVDALRREGRAVQGAAVADLIASDPRFAAAREDRERLAALLAVGARALAPDQRTRFRALVLAQVVPYGIAPAEFDSVLR